MPIPNIFLVCARPCQRWVMPVKNDRGPRWVQDKAVFWCKGCNTDFSFLVRKHHCRHCGHVFCAHCCSNRRAIVKYGYGEPVRLCNKCNGMCFRGDLLLNAVSLNDMQTVQKLVDEGCDVNFTTSIFPPLTIAANRGFSDVVRLLIRNSADVNHFVSSCDTNLIMQCQQCGRTSAVSASNPTPSSPTSWTRPTTSSSYSSGSSLQDVSSAPVHRCPFCKSSSMRDNSVDDHAGLTALHASVQKEGHLDVLVALLEGGVNVDATTGRGNTPLMYASAGGHAECVKVLLSNGANPSVQSHHDGDTPLHKAVREGHLDIVQLLLAEGADPAIINIAGLTCRELADRCRRADIASVISTYKRLVAAPALPNHADASNPPLLRLGSRFPYSSEAGYPPTPTSAASAAAAAAAPTVAETGGDDNADRQLSARFPVSDSKAPAAAAAVVLASTSSLLDALSSDDDASDLPTRVDDSDAWSRPSTLGGDVQQQQQQQHSFPASFLAEASHEEREVVEAEEGQVPPGVAGELGAGPMSLSPPPHIELALEDQQQQQQLQLQGDAAVASASFSPSGRTAGGKGTSSGKKGKSKK